MEEPIWTIGPSRPTEAPTEIKVAVTKVLIRVTRCRIWPPCRARECMTSGTPGPRTSCAQKVIIGPMTSPTAAGISSRMNQEASLRRLMKFSPAGQRKFISQEISQRKKTAPRPARAPMVTASRRGTRISRNERLRDFINQVAWNRAGRP